MERFNYPNLKAVYEESAELLQLMECEHWGRGKDEEEELEMQKHKANQMGKGGE